MWLWPITLWMITWRPSKARRTASSSLCSLRSHRDHRLKGCLRSKVWKVRLTCYRLGLGVKGSVLYTNNNHSTWLAQREWRSFDFHFITPVSCSGSPFASCDWTAYLGYTACTTSRASCNTLSSSIGSVISSLSLTNPGSFSGGSNLLAYSVPFNKLAS